MKLVVVALLWALLAHAAALEYKPGDEVLDRDGEPCRILRADADDPNKHLKPYQLRYSNGCDRWAAESEISLRVVASAKSKTDGTALSSFSI